MCQASATNGNTQKGIRIFSLGTGELTCVQPQIKQNQEYLQERWSKILWEHRGGQSLRQRVVNEVVLDGSTAFRQEEDRGGRSYNKEA